MLSRASFSGYRGLTQSLSSLSTKMPNCPLIRPFDPLDIHIGQHDGDGKYIQEILYYLDSRFRAALIHRSTGHNDESMKRFIFAGLSMELVCLYVASEALTG